MPQGAVRLPDSAGGDAISLWRQAYSQLRRAEESGWPASHPFLWGGAFGNRQIVHGKPGDGLALTFHFPAGVGDGVYAKLIGRPGLAAIVTIDRGLCRFLSVQFLNCGLAHLPPDRAPTKDDDDSDGSPSWLRPAG
jgi:hypothetical protein